MILKYLSGDWNISEYNYSNRSLPETVSRLIANPSEMIGLMYRLFSDDGSESWSLEEGLAILRAERSQSNPVLTLQFNFRVDGWSTSSDHTINISELIRACESYISNGDDLEKRRFVDSDGLVYSFHDGLAMLRGAALPPLPTVPNIDTAWYVVPGVEWWLTRANQIDRRSNLAPREILELSSTGPRVENTYTLWFAKGTPDELVCAVAKNGVVLSAIPCPPNLNPNAPKQEPEIMPNTTEIDPSTRAPDMMAKIGITRCKTTNKLLLSVDAKPLHDLLDSIGCAVDTSNEYKDRPACQFSVVRSGSISTELLLKRQYPTVASLSGIFSQPPSIQELRDICASAHGQIRKILQHYQPIDISVTINKRILGSGEG